MFEPSLIREILEQIKEAAERILRRTEHINIPDDFYRNEENLDKLDAVCMMLIAIGESLKKIERLTDGMMLEKYPEVDWKGLKGIRDIISHQYFNINANAVLDACRNDIPVLLKTIILLIKEIK